MRAMRPSDGILSPDEKRRTGRSGGVKSSVEVSRGDSRAAMRARKAMLKTGIVESERLARAANAKQYDVLRGTFGIGIPLEYCEACERKVKMPCIACNAKRHAAMAGPEELPDGENDIDETDPDFTPEALEKRIQEVRLGLRGQQ